MLPSTVNEIPPYPHQGCGQLVYDSHCNWHDMETQSSFVVCVHYLMEAREESEVSYHASGDIVYLGLFSFLVFKGLSLD